MVSRLNPCDYDVDYVEHRFALLEKSDWADSNTATSIAKFDRLERDFTRLAQAHLIPDTKVEVDAQRGRPPFPGNPGSERLAAQAVAIYQELSKSLSVTTSGCGSDANYAVAAGIPALDGLGLVGGNDHEPTEYGEQGSIAPRVYLLTRMIMECGHAKN